MTNQQWPDQPPPPPPPAPSADAGAAYYPGEKWEYKILSARSIAHGTLEQALNVHGAHGWEVVGFAASDKTIGLNSLEVVMKRRVVPGYQPPAPGPPRRQRL